VGTNDIHHGHEGQDLAGCHGMKTGQRLGATLGIILLYMAVEVAGGIWTGSLALLSDAGHMASDAAALGLSLFALWIAQRPPTPHRTFGYYRAEILAALVNAAALFAVAVLVIIAAVERLQAPRMVMGGPMLAIATGGLLVNLAGLALLHGVRGQSLNIRGAFLHLLGDTLGSLGAMLSGAAILGPGWTWADPVASIVIATLIVFSAWRLLKDALSVLMEGTPAHVDPDRLRTAIQEVPGVCEIHDLHIWTIGSGLHSLSCHVLADRSRPYEDLLAGIRSVVAASNIGHVTIQIESRNCGLDCQAPPG
jgi:cobalt-zinc-cadmium efflux system protein